MKKRDAKLAKRGIETPEDQIHAEIEQNKILQKQNEQKKVRSFYT